MSASITRRSRPFTSRACAGDHRWWHACGRPPAHRRRQCNRPVSARKAPLSRPDHAAAAHRRRGLRTRRGPCSRPSPAADQCAQTSAVQPPAAPVLCGRPNIAPPSSSDFPHVSAGGRTSPAAPPARRRPVRADLGRAATAVRSATAVHRRGLQTRRSRRGQRCPPPTPPSGASPFTHAEML